MGDGRVYGDTRGSGSEVVETFEMSCSAAASSAQRKISVSHEATDGA